MDWGSCPSGGGNDHPPGGADMTEPKTIAEQLDAAETGQEFGHVILGLFTKLENLTEGHEDG